MEHKNQYTLITGTTSRICRVIDGSLKCTNLFPENKK